MPTSQIKKTAIHEAAHAVVGHALGMRITGATIKPDGDTLGKCIANKSGGSLRSAVWAAAGPAAEFLYLKSVGESQDIVGAERDWLNLENAIAEVLPELRGAYSRGELMQHPVVVAVTEDAGELCVQYGDEIEHIANYLITRKTLHRDDIQMLLKTGSLEGTREPALVAARGRDDKPSPLRGGLPAMLNRPIGHAFRGDVLQRHGLHAIPSYEERVAILERYGIATPRAAARVNPQHVTPRAAPQLAAARAAGKRGWQAANAMHSKR